MKVSKLRQIVCTQCTLQVLFLNFGPVFSEFLTWSFHTKTFEQKYLNTGLETQNGEELNIA